MTSWGVVLVAAGSWEAYAYTSRRVPTVTALVHTCQRRRRRTTRLLILASLAGLGHHFLTDRP